MHAYIWHTWLAYLHSFTILYLPTHIPKYLIRRSASPRYITVQYIRIRFFITALSGTTPSFLSFIDYSFTHTQIEGGGPSSIVIPEMNSAHANVIQIHARSLASVHSLDQPHGRQWFVVLTYNDFAWLLGLEIHVIYQGWRIFFPESTIMAFIVTWTIGLSFICRLNRKLFIAIINDLRVKMLCFPCPTV